MVTVSVADDRLRLEVQGWHKLFALKSELEVPLARVKSVRQDSEPALGWCHGIKLPGTDLPGIITAGTFYQRDGAVFFDVEDPERTIVIELEDDEYRRLVVEVADPPATIRMLQTALANQAR